MPCLICGTSKTVDAHLIPRSFAGEVAAAKGEQHLILHRQMDSFTVSNTGVYDRGILCGPCDSILGAHESYAFKILKELRMVEALPGTMMSFGPVDGDTMVRFAAGIAWKYANTTPERGRIAIGPYKDRLAQVAFEKKPIADAFDVSIWRLWELDGDVYFYRTPMPDRKHQVNMVRFTVGGCVIFLKIDRRPNGPLLPPDCWLRGRTEGRFVIADAQRFEEGRIHKELATGTAARNFFGNMLIRRFEKSVKETRD
ncbi:hypothetical protein [Mesorhizobium sp.]|uniref:hypothetical protein n=1 Tax=Mesorhizobium sp. TaxID=1871066 RepID=UPI000FE4D3D5|nr:hypothetical protein [Mesorhizobium sp.]RWP01728.1 MAG: hypothetical protein EOQ99_24730 [Mesorhizobium sp.]